jgi:LuxR family maltose regulon positive regulatory protein
MTKARQIDPSFVLKIASPGAKGSIVPRTWLTRLFDRVRDHRFVVVHAQGGYGKTTLLLEWRRELLRTRSFVGWLTIDERDDAPRFLYGLIACLREATGNPHFGNDALDAAKAAGEEIGAMTAILAAIAESARPITILLDDAHLLPEATSRLMLPYLLHNLPANMQVVAGARQPLRIATSELVARGEFVAIGTEDLRLRLDETIECVRSRFGTRFDVDACARIHDAVDGWPIALRLAVSVLDQEPAAGVAAITGSSRVGMFFAETVLARLPSAEADFVIAISMLDALQPDLCHVVTGIEDAGLLLARLQAASPIFASSEGSDWLRMHPLARGAFAGRFATLPIIQQRDRHWRAAQWLHTYGDVEAAARHAMAADRSNEAYEWIGQHLLALAYRGHVSEVLSWAEKLPPEIAARPEVTLAIGWVQTVSYLPGAVDNVRRLASSKNKDVRYETAMIMAVNALYADEPDRAETLLHEWDDSPQAKADRWRQIHANVATIILVERGESERARYQQSLARQTGDDANAEASPWYGDFIVALSYLHEARPRLAEQVLRPAIERAEAARGRRGVSASMLGALLGAALWEQDRRAEAESALAYRLDVVERSAMPEGIVTIYVTLARIALATGEEDRALDLLQRLFSIGDVRGLPRLVLSGLAEQIRLHAAGGRTEACAQLAKRLDSAWADVSHAKEKERRTPFELIYRLGRARAHIVAYEFDAARTMLETARTLARQFNRQRELLESSLLIAMIGSPNDPDTIGAIRESLTIAERNGLVRLFADVHPGMLESVRGFVQRRDADDLGVSATFIDRILGDTAARQRRDAAPTPSGPPERKARTVPALLTAKESLILDHLAEGMANKEIARVLGLETETVKWHLKAVYAKLNAGSRRHAVDRARMLGLL